ncbi:MAG: non-canonical purine NTP pyrophosphatase [Deltaproteobacteria bacterium]|nr:non-canonical purine NTP pyrophosphatase [Deltaproteobacteria bacterium]
MQGNTNPEKQAHPPQGDILRFVTSNPHKIREAMALLPRPVIQVKVDLEEIQSASLKSVVVQKTRLAFHKLRLPLIVEDSSLVFAAWKKLPGPFIKYFEENMGLEGLVDALEPFGSWAAEAVCGVGYHDGTRVYYFEESIRGTIVPPVGDGGFGWDAIFCPQGSTQTFAQMTPQEKNAISMRAKAMRALGRHLQGKEPLPPVL